MKLQTVLPTTDYHFRPYSYVDKVNHLRASKQSAFNQIILARVEIVRFVVFSTVELGVHLFAASAKLAMSMVTRVPLRTARIEVGLHVARSTKLAAAILCIPFSGLVRPEWSVTLCQRLSIVKDPKGRWASTIHRIITLSLTLSALYGVAQFHDRYYGYRPPDQGGQGKVLKILMWNGLGSGMVIVGLAVTCVMRLNRQAVEESELIEKLGPDYKVKEALILMGLEAGCSKKDISRVFRQMSLKPESQYRSVDKGGSTEMFQRLVSYRDILLVRAEHGIWPELDPSDL